MRYFAEIKDNIVQRVIVIGDEGDGPALCNQKLGGEWLETSRDGSFRGRYCGRGYIYYPAPIDAFGPPKPYESWTLDEGTLEWKPPILPENGGDGKPYQWSEDSGKWLNIEEAHWNEEAGEWVEIDMT
jgi:hypothetical protein